MTTPEDRARAFLASLPVVDDDDGEDFVAEARREAWEAQQAKWTHREPR